MGTKRFGGGVEVKDAEKGTVTALFSRFGQKDSDNDVTEAGAFEEGARVVISAYGHGSHTGSLPVGHAILSNQKDHAVAQGQFYLDTPHGLATFRTVKRLADEGLGEWSYAYDPIEWSMGDFEGDQVRFLKKLKVSEVSPVLQGAGTDTQTLAAKARKGAGGSSGGAASYAAMPEHETSVDTGPWDAVKAIGGVPISATITDLRSMFAYVDPSSDPEDMKSYRGPHHLGINGAANLKACLMGIAQLNSGRGLDIPAGARQGVYDHLKSHLEEMDREAPELLPASSDLGALKMADHGLIVLSDLATFRSRVADVLAMRAKKNKSLSGNTVELLDMLKEELQAVQSLLDGPQIAAANEYVRFIASQYRD